MRRLLLGACLVVLAANGAALSTGAADETPITSLPAEPLEPFSTDALDPTTTTAAVPLTTTTPPPRPIDPPTRWHPPEALVVIGTIEIPKLGVAAPLNQGISLRTINRGPSHWPGTALPGDLGNTVIAGHRTTYTRPFRHIDTLVEGDEIVFTVNGTRSVYHVTGHEVVTPDALWITDPAPDAIATLFACHPPGSARYRYVVRAALASTASA